jgi:hypothetical protein
MADLKISQLDSITVLAPAVDVLPVVSGGVTKKILVNQILASGGVASLASATITGNLTVDTSTLKVDSTNHRVGIGTPTPLLTFVVSNAGAQGFEINPSGSIVSGGIDILSFNRSTSLYKGVGFGAESYLFRVGTTSLSDAMTLNSSGNVGVGVTPSAWGTFKAIDLGTGSSISGASSTTALGFNNYWNGSNYIYKLTAAAGDYRQTALGHAWYTAASGTAGNTISFTQAMTLDATGNLLVGTTTNTNTSRVFARGTGGATTLAIQSSTGDTANPSLLVGKFDNDSTTSQILVRFTINNNAGGSGQINANGASQAAFGSFSDSRLKDNIVSLPSQLANILSLRPVEFDYKDGSGHQTGFVAQEMQKVYSDAVGEQNGFLTITGWSKTEARLVSAIKELAVKVQALEAKLA